MRKLQVISFLTIFSVSGLLLSSCSNHSEPNVELIQDMMESPAVKAQDYDPEAADGRAMKLPPEGTIPRGPYKPYTLTDGADAEKIYFNPLKRDEELMRGQKLFSQYCAVCHGALGDGQGPVAGKFPPGAVRSLLTDQVKNYKDGYIYHMITAGRGLMGSYGNQIPKDKDRWAVVNYVRHLGEKSPAPAKGQ